MVYNLSFSTISSNGNSRSKNCLSSAKKSVSINKCSYKFVIEIDFNEFKALFNLMPKIKNNILFVILGPQS